MSLALHLGQRQEQRLALLPQMLQSIEVLQLATEDLVQFLEAEALQNEVLDLQAPPPAEPPAVAVREREADEPDWRELRRGGADTGEDGKLAFLANVPAAATSLVDFVRQQLAFREVPAVLADAVVQLAEHLDERGLLPFPLADLAVELDVPLALLEEARAELRTLEPLGIGAADPIEAMLLQAAGDPDLERIECLLRHHLQALSRNKLPEVAKAVGLAVDDLRDLLDRMRELDPRPAAAFTGGAAAAIRPDAWVTVGDGSLTWRSTTATCRAWASTPTTRHWPATAVPTEPCGSGCGRSCVRPAT